LKQISESAVLLAQAADSLPTDVEQVVKSTLEEVDTRQEGLQSTLRQAEEALMRAENVVSGLNQTAANLTSAGEAWDATFQTLGLGDRKSVRETLESEQVVRDGSASGTPATAQQAGRPFDIFDYRDTAEELRSVAIELRGLVQDVNALAGETDDDAPLRKIEMAVQAAATVAADQGRELTDPAGSNLANVAEHGLDRPSIGAEVGDAIRVIGAGRRHDPEARPQKRFRTLQKTPKLLRRHGGRAEQIHRQSQIEVREARQISAAAFTLEKRIQGGTCPWQLDRRAGGPPSCHYQSCQKNPDVDVSGSALPCTEDRRRTACRFSIGVS
jgi:hypothetical protein